MRLRLTAALAAVALLAACGGDDAQKATPNTTPSRTSESTATAAATASGFVLQSPAFEEGAPLPEAYTCEGDNLLPNLSWSEPPAGTQSFTLIVDDIDAPLGRFVHLILYDVLGHIRTIPPPQESGDGPEPSGKLGLNENDRPDYIGPCPPRGQTHRYVFTLYALDSKMGFEAGADREQVIAAMEGHVLAETRLTGTFRR